MRGVRGEGKESELEWGGGGGRGAFGLRGVLF